ncbi:MAG TPA: rhamnogalacturonan acetylesterase [Povalibacter sp.]
MFVTAVLALAGTVAIPAVPETSLPTLFIAGDSTAARYDAPDQQGWAEPFAAYFDPAKIRVDNRARGGRSSRTFVTEGLWDEMLANVKQGDFVLIQFGHNDSGALNEEPPGSTRPLRARGTIPGIGEETEAIDNVITRKHEIVHSFGWYLRKMIAEVRARDATPILLTLTVTNKWSDERIECERNYRQWDRDVANSQKVALIDVTRIIADRYQQLGPIAVAKLFDKDTVHTNPAGADANARAVVAGLRAMPDQKLAAALSFAGQRIAADTGFPAGSVCSALP